MQVRNTEKWELEPRELRETKQTINQVLVFQSDKAMSTGNDDKIPEFELEGNLITRNWFHQMFSCMFFLLK